MAIFVGVLLIVDMLWSRAELIVFALSFNVRPDFKGTLLALLQAKNLTVADTHECLGDRACIRTCALAVPTGNG